MTNQIYATHKEAQIEASRLNSERTRDNFEYVTNTRHDDKMNVVGYYVGFVSND